MKKIVLSFILPLTFLICVNEAKAQSHTGFGIRAGLNFASIDNAKQMTDSPRLGFVGGIYAVIPISGSSFSIQPEVLYTQKGATINNVDIKLNYIQIPVFLRVDFADESLLSPHLILGPYISFNISKEPGTLVKYEDVIYGLAIGAGIDVNRISIGVRYSRDIPQIYEMEEGHNSVISIVAGFQF